MDRQKLLEALQHVNAGLLAAEEWQPSYKKNRGTFRALVTAEAGLQNDVAEYLAGLAVRVRGYIDWQAMPKPVTAAVSIGDGDAWSDEETRLLAAVIERMTELVAIGGHAGELTYGIDLGMTSLHETVMRAARKQTAQMVSKVTATTKRLIREAIAQSIASGEPGYVTEQRVYNVVRNPVRADLIARTESVNAYQLGLNTFAKQTGAKTKTWEALLGACAICSPLNGQTVPIDQPFKREDGTEIDHPTAHPRCRCGTIYDY